jgi:hypothetical protein
MSRFTRFAGIGVLSAGLIAGSATAAFAGGTPTPSPVTPYPTHHHHVRVTPWQFDLQESDIGTIHVNDVEATLPLLAHGWTDTQLSPNVDKFHDATGDSVTLRHDSIAGASEQVNLQTCTVTLDQPNGRFSILADTGTDAGFRSVPGSGHFDLNAMFSWSLVRGHCPLAFVSPRTILRDLAYGGGSLPRPTFNDVNVQGEALVFNVSPPLHIFAPTVSPTDASPVNS